MTLKNAGLLLTLLFAAVGCAGEKSNKTATETGGETSPLVLFCRDIDYYDTARLHSKPYLEETMSKIVKLMPATDSAATHQALSIFFNGMKHNGRALKEATRIATLFLNNPASPARNEGLYIRMLRTLLSTDSLPEGLHEQASERLRIALLNRPGTVATDFCYLDRNGSKGNLHQFEAPQTLLIFYDPECPHCPEILRQIATHRGINRAIDEGNLGVLAIYTEGNRDVWEKTKAAMPRNWNVGYDLTGILDEELYDLPAMPTLYLLDGEKRVILKDPDVNILLRRSKDAQ